MTRGDVAAQLRRLTAGFGKPESTVTHERIEAHYERFGHLPRHVLEHAVGRLLLGDRYPSRAHLEAVVEECSESARQRAVQADNQSAARVFNEASSPLLKDLDPERRAEYFRVWRSQVEAHVFPVDAGQRKP